jgi:leader peptidase (prepilin peptidase)/N-methyltransferase
MSVTISIITAIVAGLGALGLTRWMRQVAKVESTWLASYLHVILAAAVGAGASRLADNWAELVGYTLLGIGCALLVVVDLAALRLPNVMVGPLYLLLFGALVIATILDRDPLRLLRAGGCAVATTAAYLLLSVIRRGQLGMGDVKFAGVIGLFLGWLGWSEALLGMLAAFALSGVVAIGMLWIWRMGLQIKFPFGPFMVAGAVIGAAAGPGSLVI